MTKEQFFKEFMREEYPHAGAIRRWIERLRFRTWLMLPSGRRPNETNHDYIKTIPSGK